MRSEMPLSVNMNCGKKRSLPTPSPQPPLSGKKSECIPVAAKKESIWQRKLFDLLVADGLKPEWEVKGVIPGRRFSVDIAFPRVKLAIEVDGWQHHGKTLSAFKNDRTRQNLFVIHGWRVLRFFPGEISKDSKSCVDTIKLALTMGRSRD